MNGKPFPAVFCALFLLVAPGVKAADNAFAANGFDIGIGELTFLLDFQRSIRLDPEAKIQAEWASKLERLSVVDLKKSDNRYAYAWDPVGKRQIIAIRGTANLKNAILDVELWRDKSPTLGIRLHHGFEVAAKLVFADVGRFLDRGAPIVVCGHSLGAAEAIVVGMLLVKEGYHVDKIVGSGPPKVTDTEGWRIYKDLPVVRVSSAFDPVPFLPPSSFYSSAPLVQGGHLLMLLDGPYVAVAPPEFYDTLAPAFEEAKEPKERFDVVDHRVWTYYDRAVEKMDSLIFVPFDAWESYAKPRK